MEEKKMPQDGTGEPPVQRKYKDRLFRKIFGTEENKQNALLLYNALTGSDNADLMDFRLYTLEDVVYMSMKNDMALLVQDSSLHIWEHQSTLNPNTPLRSLIYLAKTLQKYIEETEQNMYGETPVRLPSVHCYVFYNGRRKVPEKMEMRLSDLMPAGSFSDIDITVHHFNISDGKNDDLVRNCKPLYEYRWLITKIRDFCDTMYMTEKNKETTVAMALEAALEEMPDSFMIKKWLTVHRAEAIMSLITEYDEEKHIRHVQNEYLNKGKKLGIEEEKAKQRIRHMKDIRNVYQTWIGQGFDAGKAAELTSQAFKITQDELNRILRDEDCVS